MSRVAGKVQTSERRRVLHAEPYGSAIAPLLVRRGVFVPLIEGPDAAHPGTRYAPGIWRQDIEYLITSGTLLVYEMGGHDYLLACDVDDEARRSWERAIKQG